MLAPKSDLTNRRPVWTALADLFLDGDLRSTRTNRVLALASSTYTIEELEHILVHEVLPLCKWLKTRQKTESAHLDLEWLEERILRRSNSQFGLLRRINVGDLSSQVSAEWAATKREVVDVRSKNAQLGVA